MKHLFYSGRREEAWIHSRFTICDLRADLRISPLAIGYGLLPGGRVGRKNQSLVTSAATLFIVLALTTLSFSARAEPPLKQRSALYPEATLAKVRENLKKHPDGHRLKEDAITKAAFWKSLSDDELWDLMFGPKITRSWMVWSNGHCPACKKSVPMYTWVIDAKKHPWKVRCPHCAEYFPKNDFQAFYRSGLDEHGVFDPARADRKLLVNIGHPDPADPLHRFGVDDGEGYLEENKRWRFIGAYLIFGQFKQVVLGGINALATAYVFTGDPVYARKAGILLDRVADLYPTFDYAKQGLVYEYGPHNGYVSVWHDACEETGALTIAYDRVFEGLRNNADLVSFLSRKAAEYKLSNPKTSFADIQRNIETRILRDALSNQPKIHSNFPAMQCTVATIQTVLDWPQNRASVESYVDNFVKAATAVDGVTGEKGLSGYSAYTIARVANFLAEHSRVEPDFLSRVLTRVPSLRQTYRFHIDTLCLDRYYPNSGDSGNFNRPTDRYVGANFQKLNGASLAPSMFSFFWQLYQATGDPGYVQILYRENGRTLEGLPHDLFADDPAAMRTGIAQVIKREGADLKLGSVNKQAWRIALLRSGEKENARVVVLDYDAGGGHGHNDGMNINLFARGLDLLPDFGYPPVQYGGWTSPRAQWYLHSAAHNTVVVDGRNHQKTAGQTTLWADGDQFRAIRASGPQLIGGSRFERTIAMVDVSQSEFYVIDVFRVAGGTDHAKFVHGPPGEMSVPELNLETAPDYGHGTQLRHFRRDAQPPAAWSATWNVRDIHSVLPKGRNVSLRYTDLSLNTHAHTAEAWVAPYFNTFDEDIWNPILMIRRQGQAPLVSTFAGVFEPFEKQAAIKKLRRLPLLDSGGNTLLDSDVALEIELASGMRDLIIAADPERVKTSAVSIQTDWDVTLAGELSWIRKDRKERIDRISLSRGTSVQVRNAAVESNELADFVEVDFTGRKPRLLFGESDKVKVKK